MSSETELATPSEEHGIIQYCGVIGVGKDLGRALKRGGETVERDDTIPARCIRVSMRIKIIKNGGVNTRQALDDMDIFDGRSLETLLLFLEDGGIERLDLGMKERRDIGRRVEP